MRLYVCPIQFFHFPLVFFSSSPLFILLRHSPCLRHLRHNLVIVKVKMNTESSETYSMVDSDGRCMGSSTMLPCSQFTQSIRHRFGTPNIICKFDWHIYVCVWSTLFSDTYSSVRSVGFGIVTKLPTNGHHFISFHSNGTVLARMNLSPL